MKTAAHCVDCLSLLGGRFARAASDGDPELYAAALNAATGVLHSHREPGAEVPTRVATRMLRAVMKATGNPDPFSKIKEREFEAGRRAAARLGEILGGGLGALITLSVAGNQLDYFRKLSDVEKIWNDTLAVPSADHRQELAEALMDAKTALIIADNAGEVPFDLPLLAELEKMGVRAVYAVKGLPSQNDATRADMERFGVAVKHLVDTGTDLVGADLAHTGEEFMHAFREADVILSKGMANLETLTEYPGEISGKNIFFAMVVKCLPVADFLGLPLNRPAVFGVSRLSLLP